MTSRGCNALRLNGDRNLPMLAWTFGSARLEFEVADSGYLTWMNSQGVHDLPAIRKMRWEYRGFWFRVAWVRTY
jgi:hypothetical protein